MWRSAATAVDVLMLVDRACSGSSPPLTPSGCRLDMDTVRSLVREALPGRSAGWFEKNRKSLAPMPLLPTSLMGEHQAQNLFTSVIIGYLESMD